MALSEKITNEDLELYAQKVKEDIKYGGEGILTDEAHLSFASIQELKEILNLEQGSVTPLGIINDKNNLVTIIIDSELKDKILLVHPNTNKKTLSISYNDLIKFIEYENHKYINL